MKAKYETGVSDLPILHLSCDQHQMTFCFGEIFTAFQWRENVSFGSNVFTGRCEIFQL